MKTHELKTWPSYFDAIMNGIKRFGIRRLREFDPGKKVAIDAWKYTGRELDCKILYKMDGGRLGLDPQFCILSLEILEAEVSRLPTAGEAAQNIRDNMR